MAKLPDKANSLLSKEYKGLLEEIKEKVISSQLKAAVAVNCELIKLYWEIGNAIYQRQKTEGWGAKVSEKLAKDIQSAFPNMKGFSPRNLRFMAQFAKEYPDPEIGKQLVSQIPWGHNILIMQRLQDKNERVWYINQTIENGWSRSVLESWIDSGLYKRQGKIVNNFKETLPSPQSDLADQTLKDPYCFDFLTLRKKHGQSLAFRPRYYISPGGAWTPPVGISKIPPPLRGGSPSASKRREDEKELEDGLIEHIQKFLIELGAGFAFVGRQYQLTVGGQDFYIDLLFYHLKLRCFVVVELKAKGFTPKDVGQMNFYLSAADDILRQPGDNPTIGLLLCKTKNKIVAEYALRDINKPLGVAEYETKIIESLPENLKGSLPTIEEIEKELEDDISPHDS